MAQENSSSKSASNRIGIGSAYCGILPEPGGEVLSGSAFAVADSAIRSTDSNFQSIEQFAFNKVFKTPVDFYSQSFNTCIAPLIRRAVDGETTVCVIGGSGSFELDSYMLSHKGMSGFLSEAANLALQLIHKDHHSALKPRSLTFSWFKMDCSEKETLVDVCDRESKNLILRELGNGHGLAAYDLAEIELTNGNEIDIIARTVLDKVVHANHAGDAHTIMQLKISSKHTAKGSAIKSGAGKLLDTAGTGRFYFVLLSKISSQRQLLASDAKIGTYPWVDKVPIIMDWLDSKRATPPFKSSRLLLFLRDALYGRLNSSFLLLLNPTVENLQVNFEWLHLCQRLCRESLHNHHQVTNLVGPALGGLGASATSTVHGSPVDKGSFNGVNSSPAVDTEILSAKPATLSAKDRYSVNKSRGNIASRTALPEKSEFDSQSLPAPDLTSVQLSRQPPQPPYSQPSKDQLATIQVAQKQRRDSATYDESNPFVFNFEDRSSSPDLSTEETNYNKMEISHLENPSTSMNPMIPQFAPNVEEAASIVNQINTELVKRQSAPMGSKLSVIPNYSDAASSKLSARLSPTSVSKPLGFNNLSSSVRYNEAEMILAASLDVSRRENESLRQKLLETNEKLALCQEAYDSLVTQLREEGSLLIKKEQERFKKCLQDLRDYEVYKKVMEAAMIRMQQEVSNLAKENQMLKNTKSNIEYTVRKQKSNVFRTEKEVQKSQDRIAELEHLTSRLEHECKRLTKERDVAVSSLAQAKSESSRQLGQLSTEALNKDSEYKEAYKRWQESQAKLHALEEEKAQVEEVLTQEIEDLRRAHKKSLEMLMTYQEENDGLRSQIAKISLSAEVTTNEIRGHLEDE